MNFDQMQQNSKKAEAMLKMLANANRLMILCNLVQSEKTVNEIVELVGLSQSAVSQHLAKLRDENIVVSEKRGKLVFYNICSPEVSAILSTLYLIYCRDIN